MTVTTAQRERLTSIRTRAKNAREDRQRARRSLEAAREGNDRDAEAVLQLTLDRACDEVELAERLENHMLSELGGVDRPRGDTLAHDERARERLSELAASTAPMRANETIGEFLGVEDVLHLTGRALAVQGQTTVPADDPRRGDFRGIVDQPQAPLRLLDLFKTVLFDGRIASFMVRSGGIANAGVQVEGAVKASAEIIYTPQDVEAVTVASYVKYRRQDADDVDGLVEDLQQALTYGVLHEVESLLVTAITTATGVGAPDVSGDDSVPDKLLTAFGALSASGVVPNFIGLHPTDLVAAMKIREGADGGYLGGSPWDVLPPIVPSSALTPGEALVGDSRIAAALGGSPGHHGPGRPGI